MEKTRKGIGNLFRMHSIATEERKTIVRNKEDMGNKQMEEKK